jgi:uncharacterized membrane protein (DUF2068 family)
MATGAIVARILTQYSDKGSKAAQKDISKLGKRFDDFASRSVKAFGLAAAASAAFALKLGKDAVQAAIADQKSQVLLANSLRNTAGATDSAITGVENYITSLQKQFSVVDDDLRPAMARLTAATGSITSAQSLMQTALDVSASSGADLATSVGAIIKATSGQFKALKTLVPSLTAATIKSKDFGKALEEVNKATSGAAAKRAETLEFRLQGLRIAFGEVLETLGYALLPVIEKFARVLATDLIPKFEAFIALNKDKLAVGLQKAAEEMLKLFVAAATFGNWVVNNTETIKNFAILLGSIWATSKVYAFAKAIGAVTLAFKGMSIAALGTGAAGAAGGAAAAAAGAIPLAIAAGIGALTFGLSKISPGEKARAKAKTAAGVMGSNLPMSPSAMDVMNGVKGSGATGGTGGTTDALKAFLDALNKNTNAVKKNTKTAFDIATENAMKELAARQKALSGSASIAIGGGGKVYSTRNDGGKIEVNVNAGNVIGSADALIQAVETGLQSTGRRNGGTFVGGRNIGNLIV